MTTNLVNGKKYIGQDSTNNPAYLGSGRIMRAAIRKYGSANFKKDILEKLPGCDKSTLNEREKFYIAKYNAVADDSFYNISAGGGGCLGYRHTAEHIAKIKSIKRTKKWKTAISKALTGVLHSDCRKLSNSISQIGIHAGDKNPRARLFEIKSPDGEIFHVRGELLVFCTRNNLSYGCMLKVAKGEQSHHKKWTIKYLDGPGPYNKTAR